MNNGLPTKSELYIHAIKTIARQKEEIKRLQDVMNAADAFLALPPADMPDNRPFNQYTTAGDCRALNVAYRVATEAERGE